jgi:hypothetical protein
MILGGGKVTALGIIGDDERWRLVDCKMIAHVLDLRCLRFDDCGEGGKL